MLAPSHLKPENLSEPCSTSSSKTISRIKRRDQVHGLLLLRVDDLGIDLRRDHVRVAEQLGHSVDVCAIGQQERRIGMPGTMEGYVLADASPLYPPMDVAVYL